MHVRLVWLALVAACGSSSPHGTQPDAPDVDGPPLLPAPVLTASNGFQQVTLAWTGVTGATDYNVYRGQAMIGTTASTSFVDPAAPLFTASDYTVEATGGARSNDATAFAYDLSHWTIRTAGAKLHDVAFAQASLSPTGSDLYVAVGDHGEVLTSADGQTWAFAHGPPASLSAVTFGGGKFVAVGTTLAVPAAAAIATSTDGVTWTMQSAPVGAKGYKDVAVAWLGAVASPTFRYVAAGSGGAIAMSNDAVTWTGVTCGSGDFATIGIVNNSVGGTWKAGAVVAGNAAACFTYDLATWNTSTTIYDWTAATRGDDDVVLLPATAPYTSRFHFDLSAGTASVNFGNAPATTTARVGFTSAIVGGTRRFYVVDGGGHVSMSSDDAVSFTDQSATFAGAPVPNNIVAANGLLFVSGPGQLYKASDGKTFGLAVDQHVEDLESVATVHGRTIALALAGETETSDDGATWTYTASPQFGPMHTLLATTPTGVAYVSGTGNQPVLATSADGVTWTSTPIAQSLCGCTFGNGALAVRGGDVLGMVTMQNSGVPYALASITGTTASPAAVQGTPALVPFTMTDDGTTLATVSMNMLYTSTDAVTWTAAETLPFSPSAFARNGQRRYIGGSNGAFAVSTAPPAWSPPISLTTRELGSFAFTGDGLFATASGGYLGWSNDDQTFTAVDLPIYADFSSLTVTDHGFVLVGEDHVLVTAP